MKIEEMAHGVEVLSEGLKVNPKKSIGVMGSRRIFPAAFKLKVLDSYRNDVDCRGNQRATARKYNIHRRQIQKWLQCEEHLRSACASSSCVTSCASPCVGGTTTTTTAAVTTTTATTTTNLVNVNNTTSVIINNNNIGIVSENIKGDNKRTDKDKDSSRNEPALNLSLARLHGDQSPPVVTLNTEQNHKTINNLNLPSTRHLIEEVDGQKYFLLTSKTISSYNQSDVLLAGPPPTSSNDSQENQGINNTSSNAVKLESATCAEVSSYQYSNETIDNYQEKNVVLTVKAEIDDDDSTKSSLLSPSSNSSYSDSDNEILDYSIGNQTVGGGDSMRRRSFPLRFKLEVLDAFHTNPLVIGNQRATARKFGINRRQVQKWLSQEQELRAELAGINQQCTMNDSSNQSPVDLSTSSDFECSNVPSSSPSSLSTSSSPSSFCYNSSPKPMIYHQGLEVDQQYHPICPYSYCQTPPYICYSFKGFNDNGPADPNEPVDSLKRSYQFDCYNDYPSSKRLRGDADQPLCLVKPKSNQQAELKSPEPAITTDCQDQTVPNLPKKDAILFKPYLDNPISKPYDSKQKEIVSWNQPINNVNNNCPSICNLNYPNRYEHPGYDQYAVDVSFRLPLAWQNQHHLGYSDITSSFFRYPASAHYPI